MLHLPSKARKEGPGYFGKHTSKQHAELPDVCFWLGSNRNTVLVLLSSIKKFSTFPLLIWGNRTGFSSGFIGELKINLFRIPLKYNSSVNYFPSFRVPPKRASRKQALISPTLFLIFPSAYYSCACPSPIKAALYLQCYLLRSYFCTWLRLQLTAPWSNPSLKAPGRTDTAGQTPALPPKPQPAAPHPIAARLFPVSALWRDRANQLLFSGQDCFCAPRQKWGKKAPDSAMNSVPSGGQQGATAFPWYCASSYSAQRCPAAEGLLRCSAPH